MFLNNTNINLTLGKEGSKDITTGVAEVREARSFYDKKLFKKQQVVSVNLQDNIINSFINDSNTIRKFIKWTRNIGSFEDFESATNFNDTDWRIEFIAEDLSTDDDGPSDFVCSMIFISANDELAFSVTIGKTKKRSILYLVNKDDLSESLDTSYRTTHEYPFINGYQGICHSTVNLGMCSYHSEFSEQEVYELFENSLKNWKNESISLNELANVYETQKLNLSKFKEEMKIEDQDTLDSFMNESISLRTIVAPNNVGMRKLRDEKAMRSDDYEHFSEWYFRDSKVFSCIYKTDSAIVVVNVRSSKVTTRLTDLDFHMGELIVEIRKRLSERNRLCKHISINIITNELPDEGTKLDIITIDGYFEKYTLRKNSLRIPVMKYDFSKHVDDYDKYVYEFPGATKDIAPLCDPYNFVSFITEIDTDRSHNLNYFIDDMHKNSILDKRGVQFRADEYIEANSQDFASMLEAPSSDTEDEMDKERKEDMYTSDFGEGQWKDRYFAINVIYVDNSVNTNGNLFDDFNDADVETGAFGSGVFNTRLVNIYETNDTKVVNLHVLCREKNFSALTWIDEHVKEFEAHFSDKVDSTITKVVIVNVIIDAIPPRNIFFENLVITHGVRTKNKKGKLSSPDIESAITKQSFSTHFKKWNDMIAVSGDGPDLRGPSELTIHTLCAGTYNMTNVIHDIVSEIVDLSRGKTYDPLK